MAKARERLISLNATPYYHCSGYCVRRASLCGNTPYSGGDKYHRKSWVLKRLNELSKIFSIDICAYAIMSNHYHVVLKIDSKRANTWSKREVALKWMRLFYKNTLIQAWQDKEELTKEKKDTVDIILSQWRQRLYDISWFIRCLNEHIARMANKEDDCKGRFWESRFKSRALLDRTALITSMIYIDLDAIRSQTSQTLIQSDFTSIQERINNQQCTPNESLRLLPFFRQHSDKDKARSLPFCEENYLALIDWSARAICQDTPNAIPRHIPYIMAKLGINQNHWFDNILYFEERFFDAVGCKKSLKKGAPSFKQNWLKSGRSGAQLGDDI